MKDFEKDISDFEIQIYEARIKEDELEIAAHEQLLQLREEYKRKLYAAISKRAGVIVTEENKDTISLPTEVWGEIYDEIDNAQSYLIKPSHRFKPYSLTRKQPELNEYIPTQNPHPTGMQVLSDRSTSRALEIVKEYTSKNTLLAHTGDLVYWQAWLSAIGFTFEEPISEKELIIFVVQHAEGLDPEIDKKLVEQRYKTKLGPHKMATIKRRIGSLSVFLDSAKWPNPTHSKDLAQLLQKLTKKFGSSKPAGNAITKDILDDMIDTCKKNKLIDIRDRALFLFAWGSGGRRRSEVSDADMKDLVKLDNGDYTYTIPKSKTDQEGKGYTVPVKGRVAKALTDWLVASGVTEGPIFRTVAKGGHVRGALLDRDVCRLVKKRLKQAGYDESFYSAHSLRSGFVSEAARRGKPLGDIMQMTTHRSVETVMKYYQAGNIINNSASNLAD